MRIIFLIWMPARRSQSLCLLTLITATAEKGMDVTMPLPDTANTANTAKWLDAAAGS
jgi:hypothetical protein